LSSKEILIMTPFLYHVAEDLRKKVGDDFSRTVIVFPNKRAGLFMNEYLLSLGGDKPLWAPRYITINELFHSLVPDIKLNDSVDTTFRIVELYQSLSGQQVAFDWFYGWAERLLADFDDVDKNMADADKLFRNIDELKQFDDTSFLTEEQVRQLQRFFNDFDPKKKSDIRERYQQLWNVLGPMYHALNQQLSERGMAYEGALYREVIRRLDSGETQFSEAVDHYVIVGFNVLDKVEESLFMHLKKAGKAWFYWDYDTYYIDKQHEAGLFLKDNLSRFKNELPQDLFDNLSQKKDFEMIAASTEAIQAQEVAPWLKENLTKNPKFTAVVLCNENILQPILHILPENIHEVNITKGFPLAHTEVVTMVEHELSRWEREKTKLSIVEMISRLSEKVECEARDYVNREGFSNEKFVDVLQSEAYYQMFTILNRFALILEEHVPLIGEGLTLVTLRRVIRQVVRQASIPFHGEPAVGLQVMGVLETRCLDFERVIMLSVNDGVLPKKANDNSFIPYLLRKAYGLTTPERKTAVYAYYFYRLLQRAEKVTMTYNISTDGMSTGEMSRFMTQLLVEWPHEVQHYTLTSKQQTVLNHPKEVEKPDTLIKDLTRKKDDEFVVSLSPSALNVYMACPLKFYYQQVKHIKEPDPDPDDIQANTLGSIFHKAAECIYLDIKENHNGIAEPEYLSKLAKDSKALRGFIEKAFKEENTDFKILEARVIEMYLKSLLEHDSKLGAFTVLGLEKDVKRFFTTTCDGVEIKVRVGGNIDRLDMIRTVEGPVVRVVDYKTGGKENSAGDLSELFKRNGNKHYLFQTFLYCDILHNVGDPDVDSAYPLVPILFYVNHAAASNFKAYLTVAKKEVKNFKDYVDDFEAQMQELLNEIFDRTIPFAPTTEDKTCNSCPYRTLCYQ